MLAAIRCRLTFANAISLVSLFVALGGGAYALTIPRNSVGSAELKRGAVTTSKIRKGAVTSSRVRDRSLLRRDFKAGQLPAGKQGLPGPQGPPGPKGDAGAPGMNVAGTRQVPNMNDIPCGSEVVVGSLPVSVPARSRIWAHAHGAIANDNSDNTEAGLWLRLRDAANTTTLAVSVAAWEGRLEPLTVSPLSTGGLMLAGSNPSAPADPYVATPGDYLLQLVADSQGGSCTSAKPDFGWNQGAAMGFLLVGP
jgi:hypothetical protein